VTLDAQGLNMTAYLVGHGTTPRALVVINREANRDVTVSTEQLGMRNLSALRLQAPSPEAKEGVTFAGAEVSPDGKWQAGRGEPVHGHEVKIPRMSAAVVCAPGQHS
jgi:hypothetical protein